jgi:hypothetical protein
MMFKLIGNTAVMVHTKVDPTDQEWGVWVRELKRMQLLPTSLLVFTEGGGPNATQRKLVSEVLAGRVLPTAVMSESRVVRCIVTAFSWLGWQINAFAPGEEHAALAWLHVEPSLAAQVVKEASALRAVMASSATQPSRPSSFAA